MINHRSDEVHAAWLNEAGARFTELLATKRFRVRHNSVRKHTWVPEILLALSSGLFQEIRSAGRTGRRYEFRIELLDGAAQQRLQQMFGPETVWTDAVQVCRATGVARSTALRRARRNAAQLVLLGNRMRIVDGEIAYSLSWLKSIATTEEKRRLNDYVQEHGCCRGKDIAISC